MKTFFTLLSLTLAIIGSSIVAAQEPHKMTAVFVNEHPRDDVELFWVNHDLAEDDPGRFIYQATIARRGGAHIAQTFQSHEFAYRFEGEMHYVSVDRPNANDEQLIVLSGRNEEIRIRCDVTINSGQGADSLGILVKPYWAPRGAARFLELVRMGYYDGVVFNRVVPKFLTQFGIGTDYETRTRVREYTIWDDFDARIAFEPGFVSYAGSGPDSRTAEIFIVMPGASQEQLARFGENAWETPFGFVEGDVENGPLSKIYSGYGDMVSLLSFCRFRIEGVHS
eukprot:CCRYP_000687-RA/>CCRYP_000687-RA protein AED:0.30 eAED:0.30 QI:184/1/1/1/1/1/2/464/280